MYLCICNAITERQVRALAESGIAEAQEVYRALGCAPQCGKCIPYVQETLSETARRTSGAGPPGADCSDNGATPPAE